MTYRLYFQIQIYANGIYYNINKKIMNNPCEILVHLEALYNGRKPTSTTSIKIGETYFQSAAQKSSR